MLYLVTSRKRFAKQPGLIACCAVPVSVLAKCTTLNLRSILSTSASFAGCAVVGIEITEAAQAVNTHPFQGNTAFMLGNEVECLSSYTIVLLVEKLPAD